VKKLDEANYVTAATAAIAVEQTLLGIDQETRLVIGV
jgi:hypothetical protein